MSTRSSPRSDQKKLDDILTEVSKAGWTLGKFIYLLFTDFRHTKECKLKGDPKRSPRHASYVSSFLSETPEEALHGIEYIIAAVYNHHDSSPTQRRSTSTAPPKPPQDHTKMARHKLLLWACEVVNKAVRTEMAVLAKDPQLRLPTSEQTWETVSEFSLDTMRQSVESNAPILYATLISAATPRPRTASGEVRAVLVKREPKLVASTAALMLTSCLNMHANRFQKIIGVWLFSCGVPANVYHVASRLGMSVGYTTMIKTLKKLADSSVEVTRILAQLFQFMIIMDNVNRQRKFWTPRLGQQDMMMSGTASTLVELMQFDPGAFDPTPVLDAHKHRLRQSLTPKVLWERIDQEHLSSVMALHCLKFLVSHCPSLSHLSEFITEQFRTTFALHRMPDGHVTKAHPLSTSNIDEGSAQGCRDALDNILLRQLGLSEADIHSKLVLVGGDLGTIEKIRALVSLSSSCPHGYASFSWVIPLVQLWHMGWADLARILSTHWGQTASRDPSTLWHNSSLLGRKVKPVDRPEYYPAQTLVFETLEADVLDCWRADLQTDDLNGYFQSQNVLPDGPALLMLSRKFVARWATTRSYQIALESVDLWDGPKGPLVEQAARDYESNSDSDTPLAARSQRQNPTRSKPKPLPRPSFEGDHVLANSILRLRDSLWHYEFIWATADGDIGRVLQVMTVWQFTFLGAKASKYTSELLELACGFEYEFPPSLQNAIKNNWLCKFSGYPGCWLPMDLMQEHHIRELKEKSQRRDQDFESDFFQKVVSRNTRWLAHFRAAVSKAVDLKGRSASHSRTNHVSALNRLRTSLKDEHVHAFVPGRSYDWLARDDLSTGRDLMPSKVTRFLQRSTLFDNSSTTALDIDDSQEPVADADHVEEDEPEQEIPLPAMVIGGQLVLGNAHDFEEDGSQVRPVEGDSSDSEDGA